MKQRWDRALRDIPGLHEFGATPLASPLDAAFPDGIETPNDAIRFLLGWTRAEVHVHSEDEVTVTLGRFSRDLDPFELVEVAQDLFAREQADERALRDTTVRVEIADVDGPRLWRWFWRQPLAIQVMLLALWSLLGLLLLGLIRVMAG